MFVDDEQIQFRISTIKQILSPQVLTEEIYKLLPNTEFIMKNTFWVGTFPALGFEEISKIAKTIHSFIGEYK